MSRPANRAHTEDGLDILNRRGLAILKAMEPAPEPCWTDAALPLFRAMLTLGYDAIEDILPLDGDVQGEALTILTEARDKLIGLADDMRDDWIQDRSRSVLLGMTEDEIEAVDAFNDELEAVTPTLTDAMRRAKAEVLPC